MAVNVSSENPFAKSARATVNEDGKRLAAQSGLRKHFRIVDLFHRLKFGEMIAATDSAESFIEVRRVNMMFGKIIPHIARPREFEIETCLSPAIHLRLAPFEVRAEQGHAAANVAA